MRNGGPAKFNFSKANRVQVWAPNRNQWMDRLRETESDNLFHNHPLHIRQYRAAEEIICKVCNLKICGEGYGCKNWLCFAKFHIHKTCFTLPKRIFHPSHPASSLAFCARSSNASGTFTCRACGKSDNTFHYHSSDNFDLHITCAALPASITYQSNTILNLRYNYQNGRCGICNGNIPNNCWVFRKSRPNEFIACLACAANASVPPTAFNIEQRLIAMIHAPLPPPPPPTQSSSRRPTRSFWQICSDVECFNL